MLLMVITAPLLLPWWVMNEKKTTQITPVKKNIISF